MLMMPMRPKVIARPSEASSSTLPSETPLKTAPTSSSRPSRESIPRSEVAISARTSASGSLNVPSVFFSRERAEEELDVGTVARGEAPDRLEPHLGIGILELQRCGGHDEQPLDLLVRLLVRGAADERQQLRPRLLLQRPRGREAHVALRRTELERRERHVQRPAHAVVDGDRFAVGGRRGHGRAGGGVARGGALDDDHPAVLEHGEVLVGERLEHLERRRVGRLGECGDAGELVVGFLGAELARPRAGSSAASAGNAAAATASASAKVPARLRTRVRQAVIRSLARGARARIAPALPGTRAEGQAGARELTSSACRRCRR